MLRATIVNGAIGTAAGIIIADELLTAAAKDCCTSPSNASTFSCRHSDGTFFITRNRRTAPREMHLLWVLCDVKSMFSDVAHNTRRCPPPPLAQAHAIPLRARDRDPAGPRRRLGAKPRARSAQRMRRIKAAGSKLSSWLATWIILFILPRFSNRLEERFRIFDKWKRTGRMYRRQRFRKRRRREASFFRTYQPAILSRYRDSIRRDKLHPAATRREAPRPDQLVRRRDSSGRGGPERRRNCCGMDVVPEPGPAKPDASVTAAAPDSIPPIRNPACPPAAHRPLFPGTK
jgi:hypothetical protein